MLIKAVLQNIPSYLMVIFKLLASLYDELRSISIQFWWGSSKGSRKIAWVKWDKICEPKG